MPYYHVRVTPRSRRSHTEVRLDLTLEELEQRFLNPYRQGKPIVIAGKTIPANDVERIRINITDETSETLRSIVEQERRSSNVFTSIPTSWHIADKGTDVTDELVIGPPGVGSDLGVADATLVRPAVDAREVLVVHGRNLMARDALFDFLRNIDLHPLEWSEAVQTTGKTAPYIGDILNAAFSRAHAVVVLMTPDDEARLRDPFRADSDPPHETQLSGQARPNVLFEAGMAMGRDADRTVLVEVATLRPFSNVAGLHTIRLDGSSQRRQELAQRLETAGCPVNLYGSDWHTEGDFESALEHTASEDLEGSSSEDPDLSDDARTLLRLAHSDNRSMIVKIGARGGSVLRVAGTHFGELGHLRLCARREHAIRELIDAGLVDGSNGDDRVFQVTHQGFQVADRLKTEE